MNPSTLEAYDALTIEPHAERRWRLAAEEVWAEAGTQRTNKVSRSKAARLLLRDKLRAEQLDADGILTGESVRWSQIADRLLTLAVSEYLPK